MGACDIICNVAGIPIFHQKKIERGDEEEREGGKRYVKQRGKIRVGERRKQVE